MALTEINPTHYENQPYCSRDRFYCDGDCKPYSYICDGGIDCDESEIDERYCDSQVIRSFTLLFL